MRMNGNDLAACAVIALGVGGVVVGSLLGVGNQAVTCRGQSAARSRGYAGRAGTNRYTGADPRADAHRRDRALFRHGRRPDPRWYLFAG